MPSVISKYVYSMICIEDLAVWDGMMDNGQYSFETRSYANDIVLNQVLVGLPFPISDSPLLTKGFLKRFYAAKTSE